MLRDSKNLYTIDVSPPSKKKKKFLKPIYGLALPKIVKELARADKSIK
jgi:hypothetical protein